MFWKKAQIFIILIVLSCSSVAWAGTLGDVNSDGVVGIPEAVYALQVASGMRPQSTATGTYDFAEYFYQNNGVYHYEMTSYGGTQETTSSAPVFFNYATENVEGVNLLTRIYPDGKKYYYSVNEKGVAIRGYLHNPLQLTTEWYTPPRVMGSRKTSIGEAFVTEFQTSPWSEFRFSEYVFAGLETVTVPAGTFTDCMKMIFRSYNPSSFQVIYYAKDVGLVRAISGNTKQELASARVGGVSYPAGTQYYVGQGTWNQMQGQTIVRSGTFSMNFPSGPYPIKTLITLNNLSYSTIGDYPELPVVLPIQSQDGVNFSGFAMPSIGQWQPADIALTVQNNSITGVFNFPRYEGDPPETVIYVVQINGTYAQSP